MTLAWFMLFSSVIGHCMAILTTCGSIDDPVVRRYIRGHTLNTLIILVLIFLIAIGAIK